LIASCGIERWDQRAGELTAVLRMHPVVVSRWVSEASRIRSENHGFADELDDLDQAMARKAIVRLIQSYQIALNENNIEAILDLYGSEPVFMPQNAPALVGREAVRAGYQQVFQTIKLNVEFEIREIHEAGDWAWARTSSAGTTRILADDAQITEGNNELFVFQRENGDWKIHRYLFATNQPKN